MAEAAFILPDRNATDFKQEDEHNTIRAWAFNDFAVNVPLFVYNLLPETETFQHKTARATVCIDSLKQVRLNEKYMVNPPFPLENSNFDRF